MKKYDADIQKHIDLCRKNRVDDPAAVISSARVLREYAKAHDDTQLLAHADYYMASSYYVLNDQTSCLHFLSHAIEGFEKTENYEDLGFSYNLMGLVYTRQNSAAEAITSYLQALRLAEEHHLNMLGAYAEINSADLCMELEDEEEALHYLMVAESFLDRCENNERQPFVYAVAASESALIAYNLKNMDEYNRQIVLLNKLLADHPELSDNINVQLLRIVEEDGDEQKRSHDVEIMWNKLKDTPEFLDYHNEILRLFRILYRMHNYRILDELIDRLNQADNGSLPSGLQTSISSLCIEYYQKTGRSDLLQKELVKYHASAEKLNKAREHSILSLLRTSADLAVSRRTNLLLKQAADTDALTDHPNRRAFNTKADQMFDEAKAKHLRLGLEMVDIDNFKHINDTYGHTTGDDALIQMARALQSLDSSNVWSARYGGDEFVVLFHNMCDSEIKEYMRQLRKEIRKLQKLNNLPEFTISQGAVNLVPKPLNRIWDFNYGADAALYQVKKYGKDQCLLIHEVADLNNPSIEMMETGEEHVK